MVEAADSHSGLLNISWPALDDRQQPVVLQSSPKGAVGRPLVQEISSSTAPSRVSPIAGLDRNNTVGTSDDIIGSSSRVRVSRQAQSDGSNSDGVWKQQQVDLVKQVRSFLGKLVLPAEDFFSDVAGMPHSPDSIQQPQAASYLASTSATLSNLVTLLAHLDLDFSAPASTLPKDQGQIPHATTVMAEHVAAAPPQLSAAEVVSVCAVYGADACLHSSWTSDAFQGQVTALLSLTASKQHLSGGRHMQQSSSAAAQPTGNQASRVQDVLTLVLPETLKALRVTFSPQHHQPETARVESITGPGTFVRTVAARQLAWLTRQLDCQHLSAALPQLLPLIMVSIDDPAPSVRTQGLLALHHIALEATPNELRWQRNLLLDVANRVITGCDEQVWSAAAPAACALVQALDGRNGWGEGYRMLLRAMLGEAELHSHQPSRRVVWLQAMQPVLEVLGVVSVRYFSRLMPLLLEWIHAMDQATSTAALQTLQFVIKGTWLHMPPHALLIWGHLRQACKEQNRIKESPGVVSKPVAVEHIRKIAEMLLLCGSEALRGELVQGVASDTDILTNLCSCCQ